MNEVAVELSRPVSARAWVSRVGEALRRAIAGYRTRCALDALPDDLLRDNGLTRCDVPFVSSVLAAGETDPSRDPSDRVNQAAVKRARPRRVSATVRVALAVVAAAAAVASSPCSGAAQDAVIKRGEYLVTLGGCNDCHTPGYFFGKPDRARFLGGSEVGFEMPGVGVFHGPNLTPDQETGLGKWSLQDIMTAITKGRRPDGRMLAPIMPWHAFAALTDEDTRAIATFLKSLPPVRNKVPGPFGPNEQPTSFVMKIVPAAMARGTSPSQQ
jgi:mono/diheme cytochrome c family protein/uncharacterized protein YjiS (DUF1127 family)